MGAGEERYHYWYGEGAAVSSIKTVEEVRPQSKQLARHQRSLERQDSRANKK